jgi:manganese/zinc/iron transport system permease protein
MNANDLLILLTACLVTLACVIPGSFLVLRRMTMFGDALSHAVLPGIVVAYLLSGSLHGWPMLLSATLTGLLVTLLIETVQQKMRVQSDAAIGLIYTFLFAIGVILVTLFSRQTDLDQECVLYGDLALIPFETRYAGLPGAVWTTLLIDLALVLIVWMGYRAFWSATFDAGFARASGFSVLFWHYVLMAMVSLATVSAFESVGAILVISLMVGPPALAALFARTLRQMLVLAALFGLLSCLLGYLLATRLDASIAGAIATTNGLLFGLGIALRKAISH